MKTLRDLPLYTVPILEPGDSVAEAMEAMETTPLRTVVLVGDGMYMGLFNDETRTSNLIPAGEDVTLLQVGPYVHPARVIGELDMPVEAAHTLMVRKNVDVIPVIENVRFLGVVTRSDVERAARP